MLRLDSSQLIMSFVVVAHLSVVILMMPHRAPWISAAQSLAENKHDLLTSLCLLCPLLDSNSGSVDTRTPENISDWSFMEHDHVSYAVYSAHLYTYTFAQLCDSHPHPARSMYRTKRESLSILALLPAEHKKVSSTSCLINQEAAEQAEERIQT